MKTEKPDDPDIYATPADTDGVLDWTKVTRLAWRPAWSIRSRKGSLAPFLDMIRNWHGL
ncbi:hypothetical protein [Minwuia sp.]|uniref:hypothetical protein n=1 Tax=Minwuia sp. TaxID=2493630 RepID=UPI003A914604